MINPKTAKHPDQRRRYGLCGIGQGKVDVRARITDEVKPGILSSTFHFPEIMMNNITSDQSDSEAMCPEYKVVAVNIRKKWGEIQERGGLANTVRVLVIITWSSSVWSRQTKSFPARGTVFPSSPTGMGIESTTLVRRPVVRKGRRDEHRDLVTIHGGR